MSKYIVDELDAQELATSILGAEQGPDEDEDDFTQRLEDELWNDYGVDLENYRKIVNDLMHKLTVAISPLTETPYIGFSDPGMWLVKKECDAWIPQVLQWLGGSDKTTKGEKWEREITLKDKVEYVITLEKVI